MKISGWIAIYTPSSKHPLKNDQDWTGKYFSGKVYPTLQQAKKDTPQMLGSYWTIVGYHFLDEVEINDDIGEVVTPPKEEEYAFE